MPGLNDLLSQHHLDCMGVSENWSINVRGKVQSKILQCPILRVPQKECGKGSSITFFCFRDAFGHFSVTFFLMLLSLFCQTPLAGLLWPDSFCSRVTSIFRRLFVTCGVFARYFFVAFSWLFRGPLLSRKTVFGPFLLLFRGFFVAPVLGKFYAYSPWKSLLTFETPEIVKHFSWSESLSSQWIALGLPFRWRLLRSADEGLCRVLRVFPWVV